jgi:hypothetical protein
MSDSRVSSALTRYILSVGRRADAVPAILLSREDAGLRLEPTLWTCLEPVYLASEVDAREQEALEILKTQGKDGDLLVACRQLGQYADGLLARVAQLEADLAASRMQNRGLQEVVESLRASRPSQADPPPTGAPVGGISSAIEPLTFSETPQYFKGSRPSSTESKQ